MWQLLRKHLFYALILPPLLLVAVAANTETRTIDLKSQRYTPTDQTEFSISGTNHDLSKPQIIGDFIYHSYQTKCTSSDGTADYGLRVFVGSQADSAANTMRSFSDEFTSDSTEDWTDVTSLQFPVSTHTQFSIYGVGSNPTDTKCRIRLIVGRP